MSSGGGGPLLRLALHGFEMHELPTAGSGRRLLAAERVALEAGVGHALRAALSAATGAYMGGGVIGRAVGC
jgi:hypothetical protein